MLSFQNAQLNIVPGVLDEWLAMSQADQTALVMAKLNEEFPLTEWLLWVIHQADGAWLPAHPLQSLYRRWIQGDQWRQRFYEDKWSESSSDDLPSFATLLRYGFLERGVWGQEQFYRLTEFAISLISRQKSDEISFYLTPNFEIVFQWEHPHISYSSWVNCVSLAIATARTHTSPYKLLKRQRI